MIPIKEAIESGSWVRADMRDVYSNDGTADDISIQFKAVSFEKVDLTAVDEPDKIKKPLDVTSNVWLLRLLVVNLYRREVDPSNILDRLVLVDDDGFEFVRINDIHLGYFSQFAKTSGTVNFDDTNPLRPKIKRAGAILYELPDYFEELSLDIRDGTLRVA